MCEIKLSIPTRYDGCNYLSMLGLKLTHVSEGDPVWSTAVDNINVFSWTQYVNDSNVIRMLLHLIQVALKSNSNPHGLVKVWREATCHIMLTQAGQCSNVMEWNAQLTPVLGHSYVGVTWSSYIDGSVQERRNSSALAMELRLSCTNPSIYRWGLSSLVPKADIWSMYN